MEGDLLNSNIAMNGTLIMINYYFFVKKIITFHRRTHFFLQDTRNCYDDISATTRTKNNKI